MPTPLFGRPSGRSRTALAAAASTLLAGASLPVQAIDFSPSDPDWHASFDNTVKYSASWRLKDRDPTIARPAGATGFISNGDLNFGKGLVSNRLDLLSELDLSYRRFGMRVSGAAWYDEVYNRHDDNPGPQNTSDSVPYDRFTAAVRDLHGRKAEILDAFVYGAGDLGDEVSGNFRLGRHSLQWGESMFFGINGIAGLMSPIDAIKAVSVPNTLFKELVRPVPQLSGGLSFGRDMSLGGFYQFVWEGDRLPAPGSYFSTQDIANQEENASYSSFGAPTPTGPTVHPKDPGQGGLQFRFSPGNSGVDIGLYALQTHARAPAAVYLNGTLLVPPAVSMPTPVIDSASTVYPERIRAFGASFNLTRDAANVGGEFSIRTHTPLASNAALVLAPSTADNDRNPQYAIGRTAHLNFDVTWTVPANPIAAESTLLAEVAGNRRLAVTRNASLLDTTTDRDAWGAQFTYTPTYRQVLPGLDLSVPIGAQYTQGRSSAVGGWGPDGGGEATFGLNATYLAVYNAGLDYTHFYGPRGRGMYDQPLRDRDFVSLVLSTSF